MQLAFHRASAVRPCPLLALQRCPLSLYATLSLVYERDIQLSCGRGIELTLHVLEVHGSCSFRRAVFTESACRFGFHNASAIDSLLDKEDVSLEAILDEDDLLQECKAQNTRLIDYFSRVNVLQRLLGYVTGQIEGEDKGSFK